MDTGTEVVHVRDDTAVPEAPVCWRLQVCLIGWILAIDSYCITLFCEQSGIEPSSLLVIAFIVFEVSLG